MTDERLYTEHPRLYDAIRSELDDDRDVAFVLERAADHGVEPRRLSADDGPARPGFVPERRRKIHNLRG